MGPSLDFVLPQSFFYEKKKIRYKKEQYFMERLTDEL